MKSSNSSGSKPVLVIVLAVAALGVVILLNRIKPPTSAQLPEVTRNALVLRDGKLYKTNETIPFLGFIVEHYPEGILKARSSVSNGVLHGVSEGWFTNGVQQIREYFTNGVSHGHREKWYESGKRMSEADIVAGQIEGQFRRWHENGQLAEEITMKNGEPNGLARSFYPSGFLKSEVTLEHGKPVKTESWQDGQRKGE